MNNLHPNVLIFSDGSAHNGQVGAAAVLIRSGTPAKSLRYHLGPISHHTVYEAELTGMLLGAHLLNMEQRQTYTVIFAVDNQAALKALDRTRARSGHILTEAFNNSLLKAQKHLGPLQIERHWVPGHEGVVGNEHADKEAKDAASGNSSPVQALPRLLHKPLPANAAALRCHHRKQIQQDGLVTWRSSKRFKTTCKIDAKMVNPKGHFLNLTTALTRAQASILFQLRTGHAPLNHHLHRINAIDSPLCTLCHSGSETVRHYLLLCPALAKHRYFLSRAGAVISRSLPHLLGQAKYLPNLFNYIMATGRFPIYNVTPTH